jgi:hypothetical protein
VDLGHVTIEDGVYLNAHGEVGRSFGQGQVRIRPFVAAEAGVETLIRAGFDLQLGNFDRAALYTREPISGHRLMGIMGTGGGPVSFTLGTDMAYVADSVLLPAGGPAPERLRFRVRGGVASTLGRVSAFYGITYLSEEFEGQGEGQWLGTLSWKLRF